MNRFQPTRKNLPNAANTDLLCSLVGQPIQLQRRSWLGRMRRCPGAFLQSYSILRKHNGPMTSAVAAWCLIRPLVAP